MTGTWKIEPADARTHFGEHGFDHLPIRIHARFAFAIQRLQAAHIGVHSGQPLFDDAVRDNRKHHVGFFDMAARERAQVRAQGHADADADKTS